ncbi:MAG: hypothetical protein WBN30_10455, partial [Polyangiales bacterium]
MPASRPTSWLVLFFVASLVVAGCANEPTTGEPGSLNVNLALQGDITINQVAWEVRGNGITPISGAINTSAIGSTPSVEVFGIPSGSNYIITMTATSVDGGTSCEGWAEFDVNPGLSTNVMVMLNCKPPQNLGGVRVNGKFNFCADLVRVVVAPLQTSVGNDIALSAAAVDLENDDILYRWEATNGFIDNPDASAATYTCRTAGSHAVRVEVSDDRFDYCISDWTVAITCVTGDVLECELDADCDAGEVCEQNVCVPDVECNVDADCDAGEVCV